MNLLDTPSLWHVRLASGGLVHVWADAYSEEEEQYVFRVLADASREEQTGIEMTGKVSPDSETGLVTIARIPAGDVQDLHTASIGRPRTSCPDCGGT
ncbi:hypothetical protein [Streptomyces sp. NPDC001380]|uniref:hypothetical protein n=1 Tax=Streptomyces sp. NPDC001380 TaxID=3364566 RepID=UPI0036D0667C